MGKSFFNPISRCQLCHCHHRHWREVCQRTCCWWSLVGRSSSPALFSFRRGCINFVEIHVLKSSYIRILLDYLQAICGLMFLQDRLWVHQFGAGTWCWNHQSPETVKRIVCCKCCLRPCTWLDYWHCQGRFLGLVYGEVGACFLYCCPPN